VRVCVGGGREGKKEFRRGRMATVRVKSNFDGDVRRFTVEGAESLRFEDLVGKVREIYRLEGDFVLKYKDNEGDMVTCGSDIELADAVEHLGLADGGGENLFRIQVSRPVRGGGDKRRDREEASEPWQHRRRNRGCWRGRREGSSRENDFAEFMASMPFVGMFFGGMRPQGFSPMSMRGFFLQPIIQNVSAVSSETRSRMKEAGSRIYRSGEMPALLSAVPRLLEIAKGFADENLPNEAAAELELSDDALESLAESLRAVLQSALSDDNADAAVDAVRHALADPPVRRLLYVGNARLKTSTYGEGYKLREKPWEQEESFGGETVPKAPLNRADAGVRVMHLQSVLIELKRMSMQNVYWRAGFYGPRTMDAVRQIQQEHGIEPSGAYDTSTEAVLASMLADCRERGESAEADSPVFDFSKLLWLLDNMAGGFADWGQRRRPGRRGMPHHGRRGMPRRGPFSPGMIRGLFQAMDSVSSDSKKAVKDMLCAIWEHRQATAIVASGSKFLDIMGSFAADVFGSEYDPAQPIDSQKLEELKASLTEVLENSEVPHELASKIVQTVAQLLQEPPIRQFGKRFAERQRNAREGASSILREKPWEKEEGFAGEVAPQPPLYVGDAGMRVMHLQALLIELQKMEPSQVRFRVGRYGSHTEAAVRSLQEEMGISDDVSVSGGYDAVTAATLASLVEQARGAGSTADSDPGRAEPSEGEPSGSGAQT